MPQLYRVTVYHLFGQAFGFLVIVAYYTNALRDMAVNGITRWSS